MLKKIFSTLEEKFRISARPCNIPYVQLDLLYEPGFKSFPPLKL